MTETSTDPGISNLQKHGIRQPTELIDLLQVVADNFGLLFFGSIGTGLVALAIALLVPPTFTAKTTLMPPKQQQSSAAAALSDLGVLGGAAGAIAGIKNPADQYAAMLKSATIADALASQFKLAERYDEEYRDEIRKQLAKNTTVMVGVKDGLISVEVDDYDAQTAADMANAYVLELRKLLNRVAFTEAQQRRVFYERLVDEAKARMVNAEQALKASGVDKEALKASPMAALEGVARLKAQISVQEVRMAAMRGYLAESAPDYQQALTELSALRRQMQHAEQADGPSQSSSDYVARFREFKYQEALFSLYMRQLEVARIDEGREGAVIQVIDLAQKPDRKSKPKKGLVVALAAVGGGIFLLLFVLSRNALANAEKDPAYAEKLRQLRRSWAPARSWRS
jgi:uncharacterized protein involved in exopolysaccharide biosynthesis